MPDRRYRRSLSQGCWHGQGEQVDGRKYRYKQVEGTFSQPNGVVCQHMLTWARQVTGSCSGDLVELYCGNGNFTVALADNFG